ncbi:MAG: adenylate kinase [Thaumarchaeota archaeon]|nr:adenylate kinase [Candidatus Calditenuaceae archaeon]MDW8187356.1 adenylate kinase [Nitrososphaerota archaeon]
MVRVIVTSVPGSGKTTILRIVREKAADVVVANLGDFMFEIAKMRYNLRSRDEMRRVIPVEEYRNVQLEAARQIGAMNGKVLIDTHALIKSPFGYYPGLPPDLLDAIRPHAVVFLDFRPEDILERRSKDEDVSRKRGMESVEEIEEHQRLSEVAAIAAASHAKCYYVKLSCRYPQSVPFQHAQELSSRLIEYLNLLESSVRVT